MGFLQANYDKPGAGVRKDAPQKKEFVLFFEIYARKFWNLIQANLIYVLFSLPVLTVGLADAGLTFITRNFARERFAFIWEDYIETIKKNWKQALPIGIINLVISLILLFDIQFFYTSGEGISGILMLALIFFVSLVFVWMRYYIPLLIITFKLSAKQIYKNSFLLAMAGLKRNIVISLVLAALYALAYVLIRLNLAVGLTILFQVASLGAILFRGGLLGFNQPVAALEQLRLFPYAVTVGQYVFLTLACQVFAAVVLSILLTTISALSRSSVISYAVGAIVLGGCLLLVYIPPKTEWLAGPLALSSPLKYFDSYDTANLFGFPVLWAVVQAVLWCALSGVCVWLAQKVYHRKRRVL